MLYIVRWLDNEVFNWDTLFTRRIFHAQDYGSRAMWRTANEIEGTKSVEKMNVVSQ